MAQGDGYDWAAFDPKSWAMRHEAICSERWKSTDFKLGMIIKFGGWAGGLAALVVVGLLSWSLKANYDNLDAQHQTAAALPATIAQTAQKASSETAQKLGATNAPSS